MSTPAPTPAFTPEVAPYVAADDFVLNLEPARYFVFELLESVDELGAPTTVTMTEAEIRASFWDSWRERMIKKVGAERFEREFTWQHCLEDWKTDHMAWEITTPGSFAENKRID